MSGTLLITVDDVRYIVGSKAPLAAEMVPIINDYSDLFDIDTPSRMACFLGQLAVESLFQYRGEIWGPTKAQRGYEGRKDLGNTQPGDGSKFRGYGGIQVTGRFNTTEFYKWAVKKFPHMDVPDFTKTPSLIGHAPWWVLAAFWYWEDRDLNLLADKVTLSNVRDKVDSKTKKVKATSTVRPITRKVNGGLNHLAERITATERGLKRLAGRVNAGRSLSVSRPVEEIETTPLMTGAPEAQDGHEEMEAAPMPSFGRIPAPGLAGATGGLMGGLQSIVPGFGTSYEASGGLVAAKGMPVDEGLRMIQQMLFAKGYKIVGTNDGRWGQNTLDACILLRRDADLPIVNDLNGNGLIEPNEVIDADFMSALTTPIQRPIDPLRSILPTNEIAKIVPEVRNSRLGKIISLGGAGAAGLPAIGGFIWDQIQGFPDLRAQLDPILSALSLNIPNWAWFAILAGVMLTAWYKVRQAERAATVAYREGERLAQN